MADLKINGKDALTEWGVRMNEGFIDALGAFPVMKDFVTNESRLEDGKRITLTSEVKKVQAGDVTLTFHLMGGTHADYLAKKTAFLQTLMAGEITLEVPANGPEVYHLIYQRGTSYAQNRLRTSCKVACKFTEANPMNRK